MDIFIRPPEHYHPKLNLIKTYVEDCAFYLSKMTGQPEDKCREFVMATIRPNGRRAIKIPKMALLARNKYGDREKTTMSLLGFLEDVRNKKEILAPSLTAYTPGSVRESSLAKFIIGNLARRSAAKKEKFHAMMAGDSVLEAIWESAQSTFKIKNNALSGAQCSPYTPLWNKTAHSSLTSTCRVATSYGNANNERFLQGNRHYWSPDITRNNIVSIVKHSDLDRVDQVMQRYQLAHPSIEQTMALIQRSTAPYWRSEKHLSDIRALIDTLTPTERSVFLFTSNLYDLAEVNPQFVRTMLSKLSDKVNEPLLDPEEVKHWLGTMDAYMEAYVGLHCGEEMAGRSMKKVREEDPHACGVLAANVKQATEALRYYADFIQLFWVSDHLPPSIFHLPSIIRRSVIVSDTDSTIFTVSYWSDWMLGREEYSKAAISVANAVVYLAGQCVRHLMASLSGNMGVEHKHLFRLSMKNEYFFSIFALTGRAKHYFAYRDAQEGNVFKSPKMEIKGVGLRSSNVPVRLTETNHALMRWVMDTLKRNEKIELRRVLRKVGQIEQQIERSIIAGDFDVLKSMQIKTRESYKDTAKSSNYDHYLMWEEVFAPKYGPAPAPPYRAIKIPLSIDNPTRFKEWLAQLDDRAFAERMDQWMKTRGRKDLTQMLLPEDLLKDHGIPKEVLDVMDIRSTIAQLMEGYYIVLESLGYYVRNDHNTRLVKDEVELLADDWPYPEIELT